MKRILLISLLSLLAMASNAQNMATELKNLWDEYRTAENADKPQTSLAVLDRIIETASRSRSNWNFYNAWQKKVSVGQRYNWKLREQLIASRDSSFDAYNEPVIELVRGKMDYAAVKQAEGKLSKTVNAGFYAYDNFFLSGVNGYYTFGESLSKAIGNDWEFALWYALAHSTGAEREEVRQELESLVGYPMKAFVDFDRTVEKAEASIHNASARKEYVAFEKRWSPSAAAMLAGEKILSLKMDTLCMEKTTSSAEFRQFRELCGEFEKKRASYRSDEKLIAGKCTAVASVIERLDSKAIDVKADSSNIVVFFRNLAKAEVSLSEEGKELWKESLVNTVGSYYALDSVVVPIPVANDGEYEVRAVSGGCSSICRIQRHHISAAVCRDAQGWTVFAASYDSGKPIERYDISLYNTKDGKLVAEALDFHQSNGLSLLPLSLTEAIADGPTRSQHIVISYVDSQGVLHNSGKVYLYPKNQFGEEVVSRMKAVIFKDCGIYRRGDVMHCKAVLYRGEYYGEMSCASKNTPAELLLLDGDGKELSRKSLKTNDYGSVTADFTIPSDVKGGLMELRLMYERQIVGSAYARVDDFVLPDFECEFENIDGLYFAGDSVVVKGRIKSYNGHRLSVTRAYYTMSAFDGVEKMHIASDGSFEIKVPTPKLWWLSTSVTINVRSATGETLEFTKNISVGRYLDFRVSLENETGATVSSGRRYAYVANTDDGDLCNAVLSDSVAVFSLETFNSDNLQQALDVDYSVFLGDSLITEGRVTTPSELRLAAPCRSGEFSVVFKACASDSEGRTIMKKIRYDIVCLQKGSDVLNACLDHIIIPREEDGIAFDFGASNGPVWAVVSLYGSNCKPLYSNVIHLQGVKGQKGSVIHFNLPYDASYPDAVQLSLFYFRNGEIVRFSHDYRRPAGPEEKMEITWTRFRDNVLPGAEYDFSLKTNLPSEALVAIYDKSTETLFENYWGEAYARSISAVSPYLSNVCGYVGGRNKYGRAVMLTKSAAAMNAVDEEAIPFQMVESAPAFDSASGSSSIGSDIPVRSDFSTTLCWKPLLKTNNAGEASFKFKTSGKTGRFIVSAYAHDKAMHNKVLRREMTVSLPLEISVAQPVILRSGDKFDLNVVISTKESVTGDLTLYAAALRTSTRAIKVDADTLFTVAFPIDVPSDKDTLQLKLVFRDKAGRFSDALAFAIPVGSPVQTLTEAHSAVCRKASEKEAVVASLREQFVNTSSYGAEFKEIRVEDMVLDALKPRREIKGKSLTDISDAVGVNLLYNHITGENEDVSSMLELLSDYRNEDGGYSWMEDMQSSPAITAALLERNARVFATTGVSFLTDSLAALSVRYLDRVILSSDGGYLKYVPWRPGLSLNQYLYVRSFYASVPFGENLEGKAGDDFKAAVNSYLFPGTVRGLNGQVFAKVLRLSTLDNIYSAKDGDALLKSWGVGSKNIKLVLRSLLADVESLEEYTVKHPSGGIYCPNLVMPYRGLLSSEAYCHSILGDLIGRYSPETGDGIRLWLMLQKETQKWESNFEFTNAIATVLDGSRQLKETEVLVMSKTYEKPYSEIKAAGNGFSVSRQFYLTSSKGDLVKVDAGDTLRAGDRLTAVYKVWSAENRSFVRMSIPHFGCLRPVKQLSGMAGWQRYREVLGDRSVYWLETCPEEKTEITEEYFVTQSGTFTAPVVEIESMYAPHYRANGPFEGPLSVE